MDKMTRARDRWKMGVGRVECVWLWLRVPRRRPFGPPLRRVGLLAADSVLSAFPRINVSELVSESSEQSRPMCMIISETTG